MSSLSLIPLQLQAAEVEIEGLRSVIESLQSIGGGGTSDAIVEDPFLAFIRATCCPDNNKMGDSAGLFDLEAQFEAMTLHTSPKQVS